MRGYNLRLVYSAEKIAAEVRKLAEKIAADHDGAPLVLIVVLKGALFFAADLARQIERPIIIDFIQLKSYEGTESTGAVTIVRDILYPIAGRNVLVVEDVVDSGQTLTFLLEHLWSKNPRTLKVCTLLEKRGCRTVDIDVDYVGIPCDDVFLVGYGLDLDEQYRNLPALYELLC